VAGKIKLMKSPIDPIRNGTPDILACITVPQPTALLCAPFDRKGPEKGIL
jgi:hypothetical protein